MNILPSRTFLGELRILEVFEFYNFPMLFICGNKNKDIFIVECIEDEEDFTKWIYAHISSETCQRLRKGIIDFKTAFLTPVNDFLYSVIIQNYGDNVINFLHKDDATPEILPIEGEKLDSPIDKVIPYFSDPVVVGMERGKGVFNLVFDIGENSHSAPASAIGDAIIGVQLLFDHLGCEKSGVYENAKRLPAIVKDQVRLDVSDVILTSFGVQFTTKCTSDGPALTLVDAITDELYAIFSSQTDIEGLIDKLLSFNKGTLRSLRRVFESVLKMNCGLYFDYFSPKKEKKISSFIKYEQVKHTVELVKSVDVYERHIDIIGILSGGLSRSNIFEIIDENGFLFKGKMSKKANRIVSSAQLNSKCKASIHIIEKRSSVTDIINEKYFLNDITILNSMTSNYASKDSNA